MNKVDLTPEGMRARAALATALLSVREAPGRPSILITRSDAEDLARVALAFARAQVPSVEELARLASGCDPTMWPKAVNHHDAWTEAFRRRARSIRAEMLRRLGGEKG